MGFAATMMLSVSCSQYRKIELVRSGGVRVSLAIPDEETEVDEEVLMEELETGEDVLSGEPYVMNAVKDEETGEMVATDILAASSVTARFRNVAERAGYVTIGFDIKVPAAMADSRFQLKLYPEMIKKSDTCALEPVIITGRKYREGQLRGYERYRRFVASIVTDTTDFIRIGQLEIFLKRHFPDTYKMKNDSSLVSDPQAETLFGATQHEAVLHYTRKFRRLVNDRRMERRGEVFRRFVKDPILQEGIRLDTVITAENGDFIYSYLHTFRTEPLLRKVTISTEGELFADGEIVAHLPRSDDLDFYISTLSSLVDETSRYKMIVLERRVYDNAKAFLDFKVGNAQVDTTLGDNAQELHRIRKYITDLVAQEEYELDSLLIVASCSPEGSWNFNDKLAARRSNAIMEYFKGYMTKELKGSLRTSRIPENWNLLRELVVKDTLLSHSEKKEIVRMIDQMKDPDLTERLLSRHSKYAYIKGELYPELRCVSFDFHLHRVGMVKDTVHTTQLDSVYMSGIQALKNLEYQTAATLLGPYRDYNAALAYVSADRNYSALDILDSLDTSDSKVCYLMAIVSSRLGMTWKAMRHYQMARSMDPSIQYRANLDPELSGLLKLNN